MLALYIIWSKIENIYNQDEIQTIKSKSFSCILLGGFAAPIFFKFLLFMGIKGNAVKYDNLKPMFT